MSTLISGQAGIAIFIKGNTAVYVNIDSPEIELPIHHTSIPYLLAGTTDVDEFVSIKKEEALKLLELAWQKDRALHLFLILLSNEEDRKTKALAIECLQELIQEQEVHKLILNRLYSSPLPEGTNFKENHLITKDYKAINKLLGELEGNQTSINLYREAWNNLSQDLFEDVVIRQKFETCLIDTGAFRHFVESGEDQILFNNALVQCYRDVVSMPNSRAIISAWVENFKKPKKKYNINDILADGKLRESKNDESDRLNKKLTVSAYDAFENVKKQMQAIISLLKEGDMNKMRRYVEQLIKSQLKTGSPEYAAKSLCVLSQEAKNLNNYSLQLELAQRAVEIAPDDGWSLVQVADAYFCLHQYDPSNKFYKLAAQTGELLLGRTGQARIKAAQGKLEEALADFNKIIKDFDKDLVPRIHQAEVLREMWRLEDALQTYDNAIECFSNESVPYNGKAAVLKELGRHDEALKAYDIAIRKFGDDAITSSGRADVLKEMGKFENALRAYEITIEKFPDNYVSRCGRADVLKTMGRYDDALRAYEEVIKNFPFESVPWSGKAEVLKSLNLFDSAISTFDEAIMKFPDNVVLRNGRANVFKSMGKMEDALKDYDAILRDFPYNIFTLSCRADLLKELGYCDKALEAYDRIIAQTQNKQAVQHAKAAILVVMGNVDEAEKLLPKDPPRTRDEWIAYHIRCMILLKKGKIDEAIELLKNGLQNNPFFKESQFFKSALATAHIHLKRLEDVPKYLGEEQGYLSNVLRIHAFGALGEVNKSKDAYCQVKDNCPRNIIPLRDELAARYKLISAKPQYDENWLFEEECKYILLNAA